MARDHAALAAYLRARSAAPFAWGRQANDCVGFALGAVEAQRGAALTGLPRWSSQAGGLGILRRLGGLEAAVDGVLEALAATGQAHRGDVALVATPDGGRALMIVEGDSLVGPGASGARRLPRAAALKAWRAA